MCVFLRCCGYLRALCEFTSARCRVQVWHEISLVALIHVFSVCVPNLEVLCMWKVYSKEVKTKIKMSWCSFTFKSKPSKLRTEQNFDKIYLNSSSTDFLHTNQCPLMDWIHLFQPNGSFNCSKNRCLMKSFMFLRRPRCLRNTRAQKVCVSCRSEPLHVMWSSVGPPQSATNSHRGWKIRALGQLSTSRNASLCVGKNPRIPVFVMSATFPAEIVTF